MSYSPLQVLSRLSFSVIAILLSVVYASSASPQSKEARVVMVNSFPGSDLGAKINAADKSLGAAAGEMVVKGGGTISTQVIISSAHTLRVMPGKYVTSTSSIPILMKSRSALIGAGWESIIFESTAPGQFTVVSAYNQSKINGDPD